MKFGSVIVLLVYSVAFAQAPMKYEISFENAVHHEASVTVTFSEVVADVLQVRMSRTSPGRYALHEFAKNVHNVRAVDSQGRKLAIMRPNLHQWDVSGHDGTVKINYTIFGDRSDGTYMAVDNTHAHLNMPATFIWARGLEKRPIEITFRRPATDWLIATQLAPTEDAEVFTAPDLDYFLDSPTEISRFKLIEWQVGSNGNGRVQTIRLALHHDGTDQEAEAYAELCKAVVEEQIAVYGTLPKFDYGTYTFIADYLPYVDGDGMEHRNSTIVSGTRSLRDYAVRNLGTVSHEFFHAWNVERIRPKSLEPFDFEEANMSGELWFAEGFTSYYDGLFLKRVGIISLDRFTEAISRTLNATLNAPGRQFYSAVEMSQKAPFVDAATSVDPKNFDNTFLSYYIYGDAIGLGLDLTLRTRFENVSLDDFMRLMWRKHGVTEVPYTNEDLRIVLAEVTRDPEFADDFFKRHIYGKELIDYESLLNAAGFVLRKANKNEAWLGFARLSFADEEATIVSNTRIGSPLYEAGLDRTDIIKAIDSAAVKTQQDWDEMLDSHKPGDVVTVEFVQNEQKKSAELIFQESPRIEVVPCEQAGLELTSAHRAFRDAWLNQKSSFNAAGLQRFCPQCRRAYQFANEFCPFDGKELTLTPTEED